MIFFQLKVSACGTEQEKKEFLDSFKAYLESSLGENTYLKELNHRLGNNLMNAVFHFNEGNYNQVVDLLYPIRYEIFKIGGSRAQKDLFNQVLIHAALRSNENRNKQLGHALINERLALVENSPLTMRIANKYGI